MAKITNSDLTHELVDGAKIQTAFDRVPNELAEKVVPVMEVNPKLLKNCTILINSSANTYTVPAGKILYFCGFNMNAYSNTANNGTLSITFTGEDGASKSFSCSTLATAGTHVSSRVDLQRPFRVLAGGTVVTAQSLTSLATIQWWGYTEEIANA